MTAPAARFACPSDCGHCCTHLRRDFPIAERQAAHEFRKVMRGLGVYTCHDGVRTGLALSPDEAARLREEADRRGLAIDLHPRTFLLETRRRLAVVLEWHLAHESCPFYADFRCTAYDARPLLCRAYPVLGPAPRWVVAPECPKTGETLALRKAGAVKLGAYLGDENRARREVESRHAELDEATMRLLDTPGARFATGLDMRESWRRLERYRVVSPAEL